MTQARRDDRKVLNLIYQYHDIESGIQHSIRELKQLPDYEILKCRGFGRKRLETLRTSKTLEAEAQVWTYRDFLIKSRKRNLAAEIKTALGPIMKAWHYSDADGKEVAAIVAKFLRCKYG